MSLRAWFLLLSLAHGADAASSCAGFAHGAHEVNPLLPSSCPAVIGVQAATTVVQAWAMSRLVTTGHPRAAKVLGSISLSLEIGVTAQNLRAYR